MSELVEFIEARLVEDEERGRSLVSQWYDMGNCCQSCGTDGARVLADVAAKRAIIGFGVAARSHVTRALGMGWPAEAHQVAAVAYEDAIKLLASVYSDHPAYDAALA